MQRNKKVLPYSSGSQSLSFSSVFEIQRAYPKTKREGVRRLDRLKLAFQLRKLDQILGLSIAGIKMRNPRWPKEKLIQKCLAS